MKATCHCDAVELEVTLLHGFEDVSRCNCSFCSRRGAAVVTALVEDVKIIRGQDHLTVYQWGTKTAQHHFCKVCGIYTHHRRRLDPNQMGVNVAILEGVHPQHFKDIPWVDGIDHPKDAEN